MILILAFVLAFAVAFIVDFLLFTEDSYHEAIGTVIFGVILAIVLMVIPFSVESSKKDCLEFTSVQYTISEQRNFCDSEYERAMLTKEIVDYNRWLARQQYMLARPYYNWFLSKDVLELRPIR